MMSQGVSTTMAEEIIQSYPPPEGLSNTLYKSWIDELLLKENTKNTIMAYIQTVRDFFNYIKKSPMEVSENDIKNYVMHLQSSKKSRGTIEAYLVRLAIFLKYVGNPIRVYKYIPKREYKVPEYLTEEEVQRFLNAIDEDILDSNEPNPKLGVMRFKAAFTLLVDTGLRATELCNLLQDDINFEERLVTVRYGKRGKFRMVPASRHALNLLKKYWDLREDTLPYAFEYKGRQLDRMNLWRFTKKIAHKAGIDVQTRTHGPEIYPHIFRHTFATVNLKKLIREGKARMDAILIIKEALGHSDLKTTMIYLTILGEDIRDMMGR